MNATREHSIRLDTLKHWNIDTLIHWHECMQCIKCMNSNSNSNCVELSRIESKSKAKASALKELDDHLNWKTDWHDCYEWFDLLDRESMKKRSVIHSFITWAGCWDARNTTSMYEWVFIQLCVRISMADLFPKIITDPRRGTFVYEWSTRTSPYAQVVPFTGPEPGYAGKCGPLSVEADYFCELFGEAAKFVVCVTNRFQRRAKRKKKVTTTHYTYESFEPIHSHISLFEN
jgi:hypothetical protein